MSAVDYQQEEEARETALFTGVFATSFLSSQTQVVTLLTILIHFLHPLLCMSNYLDWVRHQGDSLGDGIVSIYQALSIIAILSYLLLASIFYFWALRYASDEDAAKRRRIYGIVINLIFSDFPLFALEVDICWSVGFASAMQALSFLFTILSFGYSAFRVWFFVMVRCIKTQQPTEHLGGESLPPGFRNSAVGEPGFSSAAVSPQRGISGMSGYYPSLPLGATPTGMEQRGVPAGLEMGEPIGWTPAPQSARSVANPIGGVFAAGGIVPQAAEPLQLQPDVLQGVGGSPPRAGGIVPVGHDPQYFQRNEFAGVRQP
eukprot:Hpha_TRINITY_DN13808_c0_g1::TRINITY_DN13808_c0_g1_i1::g.69608::m.69608